jgi:hypothetical protein
MPLDTHDIFTESNEPSIKIDKLVSSTNICELLTEKQITDIGMAALDGYTNDIGTRAEWEKRNARAMMLALQVMEEKTFPWAGSSNVKFPLITVAAMQYQAKAYPALIPGNGLVKCKVWGQDTDGKKSQIADRISTHMTWQNMEQDLGWEEDSDKLLLVQPIAGCAFRKRLFDPAKGRQVSKLVLPQNFVVNYFARDLDSAPRYTETYYLTENDIRQRVLDGRFQGSRDIRILKHFANRSLPTVSANHAIDTVPDGVDDGLFRQPARTFNLRDEFVCVQRIFLECDTVNFLPSRIPHIVRIRFDCPQVNLLDRGLRAIREPMRTFGFGIVNNCRHFGLCHDHNSLLGNFDSSTTTF